jgi:DNA polymerase III sliding clamp (beta) subunit (PCNA family)
VTGASRSHLATYADLLGSVVDEARLHFQPEGLSSSAVDPANVAQIHLELSSEAFDGYETDDETMGLNLRHFDGVLDVEATDGVSQTPGREDPAVSLRHDRSRAKLMVQIGDIEYTHANISTDSIRREPDQIDLDLITSVVMEPCRLKAIFQYADQVSDHVDLGFNHAEREFYASAEGSTDDVEHRVDADDLLSVTSEGDAHSIFALDYLKSIQDAIPEGVPVTLKLGKEFPMVMEFPFAPRGGESAQYHGSATYMVAPRVQSDG